MALYNLTNTYDVVTILDVPFDGTNFGGCPFDDIPQWLEKALDDRFVLPYITGNTRYALWTLERELDGNPDVFYPTYAAPGDKIVKANNGNIYLIRGETFDKLFSLMLTVTK